MGTLVKEDFGRPDRANTMVNTQFFTQYVFFQQEIGFFLLMSGFTGYEAWFL